MAVVTPPRTAWWIALVLGVTALATAPSAWAYCRTTTCNKAHCKTDEQACVTEGFPLSWGSSCITISVQADGAPAAGVDYEAAKASVERAVEAWSSVDCPGGGHPSLSVKVEGPVECKASEYNPDRRNANIVMFRDDVWPYAGQSPDTLGFTDLHFDPDTGELYDADIELNATAEPLAVGREPKPTEADLDSIVTHEVGHLLGLAHSLHVEATMVAGYNDGTFDLRTPAQDDIEGICAIYPPARKPSSSSCEPRHGYSSLCGAEQPAAQSNPDNGAAGAPDDGGNDSTSRGCSVAAASNGSRSSLSMVGVGLALAAWTRRARRRRGH